MTTMSMGTGKSALDLNELAKHYAKQLREDAVQYLHHRGIQDETIEQYRLGFEPGKIGFYVHTTKLGDFFAKRVIIPVTNRNGETIDLIGRAIDQREPKYKALMGVDDFVFNERILEDTDDVVLTGGVFDVLSLAQARLPAVCVPYWVTFKETHAERLNGKRVFICLGNDELGRRESVRIQSILQSQAKEVFVVNLPESIRDVNDFFVRVQNPFETFIKLLNETMEESLMVPVSPDIKHISVYTEEYMKRFRGQGSGVPSGLASLDEALFGGFRSGLYLLAGAASSGKSLLMKQVADHMASRQIPVVYVSWDMTGFELWARSIARIIGIEPQKVLGGKVPPEQVNEAGKAYTPISNMLWTMECTVDTTFEKMVQSIERIAGLLGRTPVVFIDHLRRIPSGYSGHPVQERGAEHQTLLAYMLKQWSAEWGAPVIAAVPADLSQEKLPEGLEASADVILSLQPAEEEPASAGHADEGHRVMLKLLKNRNGSTGSIAMRRLEHKARFAEET